jgi:tetratricopeptide (TPR) repeat protein
MNIKRQKFIFQSLLSSLILIFILAISGCNEEKIKVMFDQYEKNGGQLDKLKSIAVLDLGGKNSGMGSELADTLADQLNAQGYFSVIDRESMIKTLKDKCLPTSGVVTPDVAKVIAEALCVDALVYGDADANFYSTIRYKDQFIYPSYTGPRYRYNIQFRTYTPYLNRTGNVRLEIKFYDTKINKEIGSIDLNKSYNKDYQEFYKGTLNLKSVYYFDRLENYQMPSDEDMMVILANYSIIKLISEFTPYYVSHIRKLRDTHGTEQANNGKWDEAKNIWEQYLKNSPDNENVNTNLGIYYERQGDPARALSYYQKALEQNPESVQLKNYADQTKHAAEIRKFRKPVCLTSGTPVYKVVDVKNSGKVYLLGGQDDNIKPGNTLIIARPQIKFKDDLVTPEGTEYYPIGELKIEKVVDGVAWGTSVNLEPGKKPMCGDVVIP